MRALILTLITFLLNFDCIRSTADGNLAQFKLAKQSSNYSSSGYLAGKAVDGDFKGSDFSHTELKAHQWWTVDLGKSYEITNIELYNRDSRERVRLQKVYILTSTNPQPPDPNPNSQSWLVRYYHDPPYGALGNIILEEGVPARHLAVFSAHNEGVILAEVKVYSYRNLAYKAKASQSTTYDNYSATRAVDGILFGEKAFSHTDGTSSWWMVDLGKQQPVALVELYSRTDLELQRFQQMSLWSSTSETPELIPNGWTTISTYEGTGEYDPVAVFTHHPDKPIRYLGVTTKHKEDIITLKEVQVFAFPRHNHAFGKPTDQESTYDDSKTQYDSSVAVDGDSTAGVFSHTKQSKNKWWKVDLGKSIIFQYAKIYPRSGEKCRNDQNKTVECADRMVNVTYLTNHKVSSQPPKNDTDGWKLCIWMEDPLGTEFTITCQNGRTPYTRQFAIVGGNEYGVGLAEVEVYGYNQPLVKQDSIQINHCNRGYVEITFPKWTDFEKIKPWIYNTLPDSLNKLRYTVSIDGHDPINSSSETDSSISFQLLKEKIARSFGRFEISCLSDEGVCPGPVTFGTVKKDRVCTAEKISTPIYEKGPISRSEGTGKKFYNYTITWQEPTTNCDGLHLTQPYIYKINNETEMYTKNARVSVLLEAVTKARFEVKAKTVDCLTSEATSIEIQIPSAAPGPPLYPTMQTVDKGCVSLSWKKPTYSNGEITSYQYKCSNESLHDVSDIEILKTSICKQSPYTNVTCTVRAINDATEPGDESLPASAFTACAPPSSPGNLSWQKIGDVIKEMSGLRKRNYNVSWQEPASKNCRSISLYAVKADHILSQNVTNRSTMLTLNAGVKVKVSITARNIAGWSQPLTKQLLTDPAAPSQPTDLKLATSTKKGCVTFTWKKPVYPNGRITRYQTICTDEDRWNYSTNNTSTRICGFRANQLVTCKVRANTEATNSGDEATSISVHAPCEDPEPTISISGCCSEHTCNDSVTLRVTIVWKRGHGCLSADIHSNITVTSQSKVLVAMRSLTGDGHVEFSDLYGGSNYSITVKNNDDQKLLKFYSITTCEIAPADGPSLVMSYSSTCVYLHIKSPKHPNGVITKYQYWCSELESKLKGLIQVNSSDIANGFIPSVCQLAPSHKISCQVSVLNKVGASPITVKEGYTKASVLLSKKIEVLPADNKQPRSVVIRIFPVTLEDSDLVISSYQVLITKHANSPSEKGSSEKKWTKVAELSGGLVKASGYIFYVGDGRKYGNHTNGALIPGISYFVKTAITVQLSKRNVTIYQEIDQETEFKAASIYCKPPQEIENSIHDGNGSNRVGETVLYACKENYFKSGGDAMMQCFLSSNYTHYWKGSDIVCSKVLGNEGMYIGVGVGSGVLLVALVAAIVAVVIKIRRRTTGAPHSSQEANLNQDYMHMSPQEPSNYAKLAVTDTETPKDHQYDNLGSLPEGEYETVSPC